MKQSNSLHRKLKDVRETSKLRKTVRQHISGKIKKINETEKTQKENRSKTRKVVVNRSPKF